MSDLAIIVAMLMTNFGSRDNTGANGRSSDDSDGIGGNGDDDVVISLAWYRSDWGSRGSDNSTLLIVTVKVISLDIDEGGEEG